MTERPAQVHNIVFLPRAFARFSSCASALSLCDDCGKLKRLCQTMSHDMLRCGASRRVFRARVVQNWPEMKLSESWDSDHWSCCTVAHSDVFPSSAARPRRRSCRANLGGRGAPLTCSWSLPLLPPPPHSSLCISHASGARDVGKCAGVRVGRSARLIDDALLGMSPRPDSQQPIESPQPIERPHPTKSPQFEGSKQPVLDMLRANCRIGPGPANGEMRAHTADTSSIPG